MAALQQWERKLFSTLNTYVEPAVRKGFLSPRFAPAGLIVLESTGYISGQTRSTPLLATRLGPYFLVSTVRGQRSFWVRNLVKDNTARIVSNGKARNTNAIVVAPGHTSTSQEGLGNLVSNLLSPLTNKGWAFALLGPA